MADGDLPFTCTYIAGIYLLLMSLEYMGGSVLREPIQTLQGFSCSEFVTRKVFSHSSPCLFTSQKSGIDLLHVEHMWNPTAPSVQTAGLPTKQPQTWLTVRIKRNILAVVSLPLNRCRVPGESCADPRNYQHLKDGWCGSRWPISKFRITLNYCQKSTWRHVEHFKIFSHEDA